MGVGEQVEESPYFFMDDALVFWKPDEGMLLNLGCVFLCLWLNVNLTKSEFERLDGRDDVNRLANVWGCKRVKLSINYLGCP